MTKVQSERVAETVSRCDPSGANPTGLIDANALDTADGIAGAHRTAAIQVMRLCLPATYRLTKAPGVNAPLRLARTESRCSLLRPALLEIARLSGRTNLRNPGLLKPLSRF